MSVTADFRLPWRSGKAIPAGSSAWQVTAPDRREPGFGAARTAAQPGRTQREVIQPHIELGGRRHPDTTVIPTGSC